MTAPRKPVAWMLDSDTPKDRVATTDQNVVAVWKSSDYRVVPLSRSAMDSEHWAELHRLRVESVESTSGKPWREIAAVERAARIAAERSAPDLQPLWALVETWEKDGAECRAVATDQEEQGYGEDAECNYSQAWRFEECAAALRQLLEAMQ